MDRHRVPPEDECHWNSVIMQSRSSRNQGRAHFVSRQNPQCHPHLQTQCSVYLWIEVNRGSLRKLAHYCFSNFRKIITS
jgi:hypothetical protein